MLFRSSLWLFEFTGNLATLLIVVLMIWGTWQNFENAWLLGDSSMDAQIPVWPPKLIIFVGFCLLFVRCVIAFIGYIRLILEPDAEPIGVPISPTVADIAESEAASARDAIADGEAAR